ncbi:uncharacterized protein B0I36DRAFT_385202 [Microdochium trichocladiopsis]|uniref:SUR7/PalI family-domain-containing protein n=1 Tax=Microdochium trichocladiopsis TaxID=1682393 RepID=A0A9P9BQ16_9PEZI|nr:uncharacterized protein B0I36DRAFT_385202 [Microdochium trichocladiopsis]KAH7029859.1 hypothetical protein B0I36DRAFT_385202 [Microdochium trichocladiopsis]
MKDGRLTSVISTALQGVSFLLLLLIPVFSIHSDPNHLSALQFATIDASKTRASPAGVELVGLPDVFDYQRHKQVFQLYLLNYCSGSYVADGRLVIDFCSKNGQEIWDMMSVWSLWGVQLRPELAGKEAFEWVKRGPKWLWILYLAGIAALGVSLLARILRLHRIPLVRRLSAVLAVIAAAATVAVAVAAQVTYGSLVAKADDDEISITAQMGLAVYVLNWVAAGCALAACVLRFVADRQAGSGDKSGRSSRGFVRILPDEADTEYKYSEGTGKGKEKTVSGLGGNVSRDVSRDASKENLTILGRGNGDRKYEPYRSAKV